MTYVDGACKGMHAFCMYCEVHGNKDMMHFVTHNEIYVGYANSANKRNANIAKSMTPENSNGKARHLLN